MSSEGLDDRKRVNRIPAWLRWSLRGLAILALVAHQVLINKKSSLGPRTFGSRLLSAAAIVVGAAATFPLQVGVAFATLLGAAYGAVILLASDATDAPTAPACPGAKAQAVDFLGSDPPDRCQRPVGAGSILSSDPPVSGGLFDRLQWLLFRRACSRHLHEPPRP